jgi:tol-pal system protein YbgF
LRGQIEVLSYELEAAQKRQKDFYVDLDNRLRKLEQAPAETKVEAAKPDPALETRDYEAALAGIKASKFKEAAASFLAFIKSYPDSTLAASAHYWGAYAHAQAKDHAGAAELFGKFAADWPKDERAPGALESRVASLEAIKDLKGVRVTLEQLAEHYPNTDAGKRAKLRLKKK